MVINLPKGWTSRSYEGVTTYSKSVMTEGAIPGTALIHQIQVSEGTNNVTAEYIVFDRHRQHPLTASVLTRTGKHQLMAVLLLSDRHLERHYKFSGGVSWLSVDAFTHDWDGITRATEQGRKELETINGLEDTLTDIVGMCEGALGPLDGVDAKTAVMMLIKAYSLPTRGGKEPDGN